MQRRSNIIPAILLGYFLTACGGGGGSGSSTATSTVPSAPSATPAPQENAEDSTEAETTAELVASESFLFSATEVLAISISVPSLEFTRAYLNVCRVTEQSEMDYENCLVNTPLKNGAFTTELTLGNDIDRLTMEIWRYSLTDEPLRFEWQRQNGMEWRVES